MLTLRAGPADTGSVPLRVVIIGRISTPHQNEENIAASYRYVEDQLSKVHSGPMTFTYLGERASGMLAERQTIRQLEDLISSCQVDLVVAEDLSRIFRNPRHQLNFVQDAVDAGVRVLCLADSLDTASENWELMLGAAGLRHGLVVSDTRRRVRRTATHSFHGGGMVMRVRFGYKRLSKDESLSGEFGPKGLRIAKDPNCTPVIRQMREMILDGKSLAYVADWLDRQAIRPGPYVKTRGWTPKLVGDYLRAPILHGERTFRQVVYQPILRTGKHRRERNLNPERACYAELAHITAEEHVELIQALQTRTEQRRRRRGRDHPRYRVPRSKAVWPAQQLTCQICGGLMYSFDRGQLKCSNTLLRGDRQCWNRVQVHAALVRRGALHCLWDTLQQCSIARESFLAASWKLIQQQMSNTQSINDAEQQQRALEQQADRLAKAIADGGEMAALVKRLKEVQASLAAAGNRRSALELQVSRDTAGIDRKEFYRDPLGTLLNFCGRSYEFAELVTKYITRATVAPVQDLMHGQVRPRIKLTIRIASTATNGDQHGDSVCHAVFDAFDKPQHIVHLGRLREIKEADPCVTHAQIAASLGIKKDAVKRLVRYSKLMEGQAVTEPYRELMEKPARASRWRKREEKSRHDKRADSEPDERS
jgi:DNA invertase Pin-like site-specific DNA recombinase